MALRYDNEPFDGAQDKFKDLSNRIRLILEFIVIFRDNCREQTCHHLVD